MRSNFIILLVLLSVAVNVAFVSVWAAHRISPRSASLLAPAKDREAAGCPLYRILKAGDRKWKELEPRIQKFRAAAQALCRETNQKRLELIDLMAAPQVDRQAIRAKQEEIIGGQRKMQEMVVEHLLSVKQALTLPQQQELFKQIREFTPCGGRGPMMGLKPGGANCPDELPREGLTN
jgi:Spy/CpxP family protein refolding chaperone